MCLERVTARTHIFTCECEKKQAYQVVIVLVFKKIVRDLYTNHEVYKKKTKQNKTKKNRNPSLLLLLSVKNKKLLLIII